ncbi:peptide-methionine (S)-S-oxide reductase [Maritimibacter sp. 55A14]|uniref:peptide-methionine (S)-S-oxide reductase MsrA n=1 Tax=Maritimibacter sp. 55A14 TaxID=2174844 RepID=UPI000D621AA6|nr:peptide-methionine (S)-S-oxide reductase MsrA [Maritimibacter sp. 55A14]PWE30046.1 peptide-methionine (S)-S-oxide reductase [Maritimibacter sp. 55A14]
MPRTRHLTMFKTSALVLTITLVVMLRAAPGEARSLETAIVAGGCFWCVEADFDKVDGVVETVSGFTGGHVENPSYKQVTRGGTGHYEAVKITYDADRLSYRRLLDLFFRSIDPTDAGGQFCDRGPSYRTAVFAQTEAQAQTARAAKADAQAALGRKIVTPVLEAGEFYPAEDYHQNYYASQERILTRFGWVTKARAYKGYRKGCGRDARVEALWGDAAPFVH